MKHSFWKQGKKKKKKSHQPRKRKSQVALLCDNFHFLSTCLMKFNGRTLAVSERGQQMNKPDMTFLFFLPPFFSPFFPLSFSPPRKKKT